MAVLQHYHVIYHIETNNRKSGSQDQFCVDVVAAAGDSGSIKTVLTNNSVSAQGGTIVIDSITQIHGSVFS
jgi:hypothetical protein